MCILVFETQTKPNKKKKKKTEDNPNTQEIINYI